LVSGDEQSEVSSTVYGSRHKQELPSISAILVNEAGTRRVVTVGVP
jgi:hypothetical protein